MSGNVRHRRRSLCPAYNVVLKSFVATVILLARAAAATASTANVSAQDVTCTSTGARVHCPADTSAGVLLQKTLSGNCLLGKTWGYDDRGIWVTDGCSGVFSVGNMKTGAAQPGAQPPAGATPASGQPHEEIENWGEFNPGDGFLVGRGAAGELEISAYALIRYMNQMPGTQTFTDHLGVSHSVDGRNDLFPHRIMVFLKGWLGNPKLVYNIFFWTVNPTDQKNIFAGVGYQFSRRFSLYTGINGLPGTRSLQGSHPYWLGHDRVMADEYFRPYFSHGIWAQGEIAPGLWYNVMTSNNLSALGFKATQLDRTWGSGGSMWWMPTTKEFGSRGGYGDWEYHEKLATRFGFSSSFTPEERYTDSLTGATGSTLIKLADSLNVFETSAIAPGVTVQNVDYRILSFDAGIKYKGFFLQTEIYNRWLDNFSADGPLPVTSIHDYGYYLQGAFFPIKKKLELYAATSWVFGDKDAGYRSAYEYIGGGNFYPFDTRNHRLNVQLQQVTRSTVSSSFGYYVGGQTGTTLSSAFSVFF